MILNTIIENDYNYNYIDPTIPMQPTGQGLYQYDSIVSKYISGDQQLVPELQISSIRRKCPCLLNMQKTELEKQISIPG